MSGNLANLNVQITSNITSIQSQLNTLQSQLQRMTSTRVSMNTTQFQSSAQSMNNQLIALSRSASGLVGSLGGISGTTGDLSANVKTSTSGLMNLASGLFLAEKAGQKLQNTFKTGLGKRIEMSSIFGYNIDPKIFDRDDSIRKLIDSNIKTESTVWNPFFQDTEKRKAVDKHIESIKRHSSKTSSAISKTMFQDIMGGEGPNSLKAFPGIIENIKNAYNSLSSSVIQKGIQTKRGQGILGQYRDLVSRKEGLKDEAAFMKSMFDARIGDITENFYPMAKLQHSLKNIDEQIVTLKAKIMSTLGLSGLGAMLAGITAKLVLLGGAIELTKTIVNIGIFKKAITDGVAFQAQIEQITAAFRVLMGTQEEYLGLPMTSRERIAGSENLIKQLQNLARYTPMLTSNLSAAGQTLMRYGVDSHDLLPLLKNLGEITGGDPERMRRMALATGQSIGMGRLIGQDRLQMVNAGFNPVRYLAEVMDITPQQVEELIPQGGIGVPDLLKAIELAAKTDYLGYMEEQSKTLTGRLSTLRDVYSMFVGEVAKPVSAGIKTAIEYVIRFFEYIGKTNAIYELQYQIEEFVIPAFRELGTTLMWIAGLKNGLDIKDEAVSTVQSVGAIIESMSTLAKIIYFVQLVSTTLWRSFTTGIKTVVLLITGVGTALYAGFKFVEAGFSFLGGVIEGIFRGIYNGAKWVVGAVVHEFEKIPNIGIDAQNVMARVMNPGRKIMGMEEIPMLERHTTGQQWKDEGWAGIKGAFTGDNLGFQQAKKDFDKAMSPDNWLLFSVAFDILEKDSDDLMKKFKQFGQLGDLFGAKDNVEDLLAKLKLIETGTSPEFGEVDYEKFARDMEDAAEAAKKLADAMMKVQTEISSALDSLVNFGNVFEKLSYERFSPAKLLSRIRRFFKEISGWTSNLATLEGKVSESVLNELRNMGIGGFGITSALTRATPDQLEEINALYKGSRLEALNTVVQTIQFEHSGTILVKGVDSLGQLKGIVSMIAADLAKDKNLLSTDPAIADIWR